MREDELLVEARLPVLAADTRCGFYEFNRRAGDFAMAMALAAYRVEGGKIVEPRSPSAAPSPTRAASPRPSARSPALRPGDKAFRAAAAAAAAAVDPLEDIATSAEFRRDLVLAVTRRALERAAEA